MRTLQTGKVDVRIESGDAEFVGAGGFEYTRDFPQFDLTDLGAQGMVIDSVSPEIDEPIGSLGQWTCLGDFDGDGVDDLVLSAKGRPTETSVEEWLGV